MLILSGHVSRGCWFWYVYKICTFIFSCVNRTPILLQLFSASVWFQCIFMSYHSTGWVISDVMGLFWHVASLQPEVPATSIYLSACCTASDSTPPQRGWRRPRGRHHISWLHQVCTDLNLPASDALNLALDRTSWRAVAMAWVYCYALQRGWKSPATWYDIESMSHCLGKG